MSLHFKHMLSSSSLFKNKEVLTKNGGGEIRKQICLNLYSMEESLLKMTPFHLLCVYVGKSASLLIILLYKITNWYVIPIVESVFPRELLCCQYVQKYVQPENPYIALAISIVLNPSIALAIPETVLNHLLL
jgi:hypothetical protein